MKLGGSPTTIRNEFDLFLVSFLSLFLEILLIRWIGTEIRVFAYFANLTLVTCFFGLGAGYASRRIRIRLVQSVWLLVLLCVLAHPALDFLGFRKISESVAAEDINIWEIPNLATVSRLYGFGCMGVILLIIAAIFIPFGNLLGDYFDQAPRRIRAYSINLAGSLAGIWLFALLGYLHTPPVIWFGVAGILYLWLVRSKPVTTVAGIITLGILLITSMPTEGEAVWSSYQKLVLMPLATTARAPLYRIEVNNTFYQYATDFSDKSLDDSPVPLPAEERPYFYYNLPYQLHDGAKKVLVVGAGSGNDVAGALRNGAEQVDAVEIDGVIVDMGRRIHPERPYSSPKVRAVVDDARAWFKKTDSRYDMIIFGLLDSHKLTSNFSNINLDSYVYTVESFREAAGLLRPGGVMIVSFWTYFPFISWRLYNTISQATGQAPQVFYVRSQRSYLEGTGGMVFYVGDKTALAQKRQSNPALDRALANYEAAAANELGPVSGWSHTLPSTDDWPYLYIKSRQIPSLWLMIMGLVVALALTGFRAAGLEIGRFDGRFFFLGAAFLFLETYTITRTHLFYGTTWIVSSVVISAILVMSLIGNAIVAWFHPRRMTPWLIGVVAAALLNWALAPSHLRFLDPRMATALISAIASLPLLFAAVIFGILFAAAPDVRYAMSSNLLGTLVGGLIECVSFITGLGIIGLFAVVFYLLAGVFILRRERAPD